MSTDVRNPVEGPVPVVGDRVRRFNRRRELLGTGVVVAIVNSSLPFHVRLDEAPDCIAGHAMNEIEVIA